MSRLGRSQPVPPIGWHGPVDEGRPAAPFPVVVPLDADRHHLRPALPAVVAAHGFIDSGVGVPGTTPPAPTVSFDRADQRARYLPLAPVSIVGIPADQFGPAFIPPPAIVNIDRQDQRTRYRALDPITLSGVLAGLTPPVTPTPPGPYVVPLDERRRFLAALPPEISAGFDDVEPPEPYVVPLDARGRFLVVVVPATGQHGFVDSGVGVPGTTPPLPLNIDRLRLDLRYTPLQSVNASGKNMPIASGDNPSGGVFDPNWFLTIHP